MAKTNNSNNQVGALLKKSEFWIGLATVFVVVAFGAKFFAHKKHVGTVGDIGDKGVMTQVSVPAPSPSAYLSKVPSKKDLKQIKHLADTAGFYIVAEGDNYWKISKKVCETGKYFLSISAQNNGMSLHRGDEISTNCSL